MNIDVLNCSAKSMIARNIKAGCKIGLMGVAALLLLSSCQSSTRVAAKTAAPLSSISGKWSFARLGTPSIPMGKFPGFISPIEKNFRGSTIVLDDSGSGVLSFPNGKTMGGLDFVSEDDRFIYFRERISDQPKAKLRVFALDKREDTLIANSPINLLHGEGTIPVIYSR